MSDRFRDLEDPHLVRKKDVVLMATVTSFEGLSMPGKTELRQFAELFVPLYANSSDEARRLAVAALSQCATLPRAVTLFIATQPIAIAAPFLIASRALDDDDLIAIAKTQGGEHAKAIAARADLSVKVVDALVAMRQQAPGQTGKPVNQATILPLPDRRAAERIAAEEQLRQELKNRVQHTHTPSQLQTGRLDGMSEALLVRFARQRQSRAFSVTLADALASSLWLTERIMLDLSGLQLATTLLALDMDAAQSEFILCRIYPHLESPAAESSGARSRAAVLLSGLDRRQAVERVESWVRADGYTHNSQLSDSDWPTANHNQRSDPEAADQPVHATGGGHENGKVRPARRVASN